MAETVLRMAGWSSTTRTSFSIRCRQLWAMARRFPSRGAVVARRLLNGLAGVTNVYNNHRMQRTTYATALCVIALSAVACGTENAMVARLAPSAPPIEQPRVAAAAQPVTPPLSPSSPTLAGYFNAEDADPPVASQHVANNDG